MITTLERPATNEALATLRTHYQDRLRAARDAHARGERVVGRVGNTIPVELLLAAGFTPVLISADRARPTPTAIKYMDDVISPETKALFEAAIDGDFEFLELLVLSRPYDKLFYYLKELYRLGRAPKLPPLHMFDLMQSQRPAVRAYNAGRVAAFVERLERAAGGEITESTLQAAIRVTNGARAVQRRLQDLRRSGRVSGVDAMQAIGAGYFMPPAAYKAALESYVAGLAADGEATPAKSRLLVVTSEPLDHTGLHEAVEAAGAVVVAEDDWWGARAPGGDLPLTGSGREAVLLKYWMDTPTSGVYPPQAREAWFQQESARDDVDGVVFYVPPSDQLFGWDYPRLASDLAARGKRSILVRRDAAQPADRQAITKEVAEFVSALPAARRAH
jgi:benzoyl-CoA reductase/2-hydroxyglutaryl-CoA dehydratase subunit BcrC/BadD/HgdB